jgi:hypothetical protein
MAESVGAAAEEHHVDTDTNYRKARDLLRKTWQEIYEMSGAEVRDPERLEKLQQKAIDITKVIELVEREFEHVEEDDWQPTLTTAPASRERKSVRRADSREVDDTREPAGQMARTNEAVLGTTDEGAAPAAYRPAESYRRPSETMSQPPFHGNSMSQDGLREINDTREAPGRIPWAREAAAGSSAIPTMAAAPLPPESYRESPEPSYQPPLERESARPDDLRDINDIRSPTGQKSWTNEAALGAAAITAVTAASRPPESYRQPSEPSHQLPYQQPRGAPLVPSSPSAIHGSQQQNFRPGPQPREERRAAPPPQAERKALPPISTAVEDENYEVPSNISFNHGPNFSNCIASMELSDTVYDLDEAKEDLVKAKEKLRKAQEHDDAEKADHYAKRVAKTEKEVRELESEHWRLEVQPLRRAYHFEVSRCLQQLDAAIKYTDALQSSELPDNVKKQVKQGQLNALEEDALHDMALLHAWLELCLRQPKTWRKDNVLLVGLVKGHPGSSLKDPEFVEDLLKEAEQAAPTSRQKPSSSGKESKSSVDNSDPGGASNVVTLTPDLLEGILNATVPAEVAENIIECPECNGQGGGIEHAKICSECEGTGKSNEDNEDGSIEVCPKCQGRGFKLSKKYMCPVCDGFKIVLRAPEQKRASTSTRDISPTEREVDMAPKRSSSTKRATFEPEILSDSGRSKKHNGRGGDCDRDRDYSPDETTRSPTGRSRSASTGPSRRRKSESKQARDPAQSLTAVLSAASAEVMKASKEPGSWAGEKGRRVLQAAIAAGTGGGGSGGANDSGKSEDEDGEDEDDYEEKHRHRKRRGSTRY